MRALWKRRAVVSCPAPLRRARALLGSAGCCEGAGATGGGCPHIWCSSCAYRACWVLVPKKRVMVQKAEAAVVGVLRGNGVKAMPWSVRCVSMAVTSQ